MTHFSARARLHGSLPSFPLNGIDDGVSADDLPVWQRLDSKLVHATPWFDVRQDTVVRPDGVDDVYHHVATRGSVTVLAMTPDDRVLVTRQWIYTHHGTQWRLPAGVVEDGDAAPIDAAGRELAEETGLRAARWEPIGAVNGADSLTNHVDHVFLARDLTQGESCREGGEADLTLHWLPFGDALALVTSGGICHAGSTYALLSVGVSRASAHRRA
jgi:8-oxo-dGTP pyrophosphatase MutT (NUDIX family)